MPLFPWGVAEVEGNKEAVPFPNELGEGEIEPGMTREKGDGRIHSSDGGLLLREEVRMIADKPSDIGKGLVDRPYNIHEIVEGREEQPVISPLPPKVAIGQESRESDEEIE